MSNNQFIGFNVSAKKADVVTLTGSAKVQDMGKKFLTVMLADDGSVVVAEFGKDSEYTNIVASGDYQVKFECRLSPIPETEGTGTKSKMAQAIRDAGYDVYFANFGHRKMTATGKITPTGSAKLVKILKDSGLITVK